MTFDQWIDAVSAQVRADLGESVRVEELSWDSAVWRSAAGTAVASAADDGTTAKIWFDGGDKLVFPYRDRSPQGVGHTIAERLAVG